MAQTFWISTGDIREQYETVSIVSGFVIYSAPAFGKIDLAGPVQHVIDQMAQKAQQVSANGVIWVRLEVVSGGSVFGAAMIGTAPLFECAHPDGPIRKMYVSADYAADASKRPESGGVAADDVLRRPRRTIVLHRRLQQAGRGADLEGVSLLGVR